MKTIFILVGVVACLLALWLAWLYPLVPTTSLGWLAVIGSGLAVIAWSGLCTVTLLWLQRQQRNVLLFKSIGVVVALSLGAGIFGAAYAAKDFSSKNFAYFGRADSSKH